ncbi:Crp/Fnr family transcriptional regulator [Muriicola marianensis]|uniref:Crp/Fnr-family transriptional regulator n=1 Tax=Muriicola marianensis TaxID=1324801 RepID=A0ABQ1QN63_9FLAO|nr:Crp/Fnr family transcriptional regulator [Muriicola marianensis]GGD37722.1 putative Crp/Fnr-family transriptional regulator [Muriicola marianensis]
MNIELEKYRYYFECLLENPLFQSVPPEAIRELLRLSRTRNCDRHTCVLDTTDVSYHFFIIVTGKVKVYVIDQKKDRKLTLTLLNTNDVFSVMSLFGGLKRKVYYETLERSQMLSIPLPEMKNWLRKNHGFSLALMQYMAVKIQGLENSVSGIALEDIPTRLAKLLYENMDNETGVINHISSLSHEEIGALIGTTRSVVNRHLNSFKNQGLLEVGKKHLRITSEENLRREFNLP